MHELINKIKSLDYYIAVKTKPTVHSPKPLDIDLSLVDLERDQIIILSEFGSKMYGTYTEDSDDDFIGIYIPNRRQILLNDYPNQINYPKDKEIDCKFWSIHFFFDLLCKGDTSALDLLHSPYECWLLYNVHVWPELIRSKGKFYTKQMASFVSYARDQATKYGIKGTRLQTLKTVIDFLNGYDNKTEIRLYHIWNKLPHGNHIHFLDVEPYKMYQVCGKKFHETIKLSYIYNSLQKDLTKYGKRAIMAEKNEGVDWKSLSHAIRAAEQAYWVLNFGTYSYPLKNHRFITLVKEGKIQFDMVKAVLDDYLTEIDNLIEKSTLPDKIDKKIWMDWLINILQEYLI